jgi:hypothetical protein
METWEGILDAWSGSAASLAAREGYFVDQGSAAFRDLCIQLNEAAIRVHEAELQRMDGKVVPTPSMPKPLARMDSAPVQSGRTFREIVLELIDKPRLGFAEPTKERVRGALRFPGRGRGPAAALGANPRASVRMARPLGAASRQAAPGGL